GSEGGGDAPGEPSLLEHPRRGLLPRGRLAGLPGGPDPGDGPRQGRRRPRVVLPGHGPRAARPQGRGPRVVRPGRGVEGEAPAAGRRAGPSAGRGRGGPGAGEAETVTAGQPGPSAGPNPPQCPVS